MSTQLLPKQNFSRLPRHVGVIPDGNRRWAVDKGLPREAGYAQGLEPGLELYNLCVELGISELTFYGFTQDNTKRPAVQRQAFQKACVDAVNLLANRDGDLLVMGDNGSPMFPRELVPYTTRHKFGRGLIKINFLVNYSWHWDLCQAFSRSRSPQSRKNLFECIASRDISRIDLIIRWGGRNRLSGFLPVQSIYADFYVVEAMWPDFAPEHFYQALSWYETQDITLGG